MSGTIEGKVALVTGGGGGLGAATARALAAAGATVVVADVDDAAGAAVAAEVGGHFVHADVSLPSENEAMVDFARERCGGLERLDSSAWGSMSLWQGVQRVVPRSGG